VRRGGGRTRNGQTRVRLKFVQLKKGEKKFKLTQSRVRESTKRKIDLCTNGWSSLWVSKRKRPERGDKDVAKDDGASKPETVFQTDPKATEKKREKT